MSSILSYFLNLHLVLIWIHTVLEVTVTAFSADLDSVTVTAFSADLDSHCLKGNSYCI